MELTERQETQEAELMQSSTLVSSRLTSVPRGLFFIHTGSSISDFLKRRQASTYGVRRVNDALAV